MYGYRAYHRGESINTNPHSLNTTSYKAWRIGWEMAFSQDPKPWLRSDYESYLNLH